MEAQSPFTHILVPTDGSDTSISAGRLAIQVAATHSVPIMFVYVVDRIIAEELASATSKTIEMICQELEHKGQRYLDYLSRLAHNVGLQTEQAIRHGVPHREIAELAREQGMDLIVIGQVGRRGPHRVHLGSVAQRVIECAPCPVLVVRHTPTQF